MSFENSNSEGLAELVEGHPNLYLKCTQNKTSLIEQIKIKLNKNSLNQIKIH